MLLTDEERTEAYEEFMHQSLRPQDTEAVLQYARAIEAKIVPRIQRLEAENEVLRKDAERYWWLANYLVGPETNHDDAIVSSNTKAEIDEAIDAARGVK